MKKINVSILVVLDTFGVVWMLSALCSFHFITILVCYKLCMLPSYPLHSKMDKYKCINICTFKVSKF